MQDPDLAPAATPREVERARMWQQMRDNPITDPAIADLADPIVDREYEDDERIYEDEVAAANELEQD